MFEEIEFKAMEISKEFLKYSIIFPKDLAKVYRGEIYLQRDKKTKNFLTWTFRLGHMLERSITLDELVYNGTFEERIITITNALESIKPSLRQYLIKSFNDFQSKIDERLGSIQTEIEELNLESKTCKISKNILKRIEDNNKPSIQIYKDNGVESKPIILGYKGKIIKAEPKINCPMIPEGISGKSVVNKKKKK